MELKNLQEAMSNPFFSQFIDTIKENEQDMTQKLQQLGDPNYDPNADVNQDPTQSDSSTASI